MCVCAPCSAPALLGSSAHPTMLPWRRCARPPQTAPGGPRWPRRAAGRSPGRGRGARGRGTARPAPARSPGERARPPGGRPGMEKEREASVAGAVAAMRGRQTKVGGREHTFQEIPSLTSKAISEPKRFMRGLSSSSGPARREQCVVCVESSWADATQSSRFDSNPNPSTSSLPHRRGRRARGRAGPRAWRAAASWTAPPHLPGGTPAPGFFKSFRWMMIVAGGAT